MYTTKLMDPLSSLYRDLQEGTLKTHLAATLRARKQPVMMPEIVRRAKYWGHDDSQVTGVAYGDSY